MCGEFGPEPFPEDPATEAESVSSINERWSDTAGIYVRFLPGAQVEEVDMGGWTETVINPKDD